MSTPRVLEPPCSCASKRVHRRLQPRLLAQRRPAPCRPRSRSPAAPACSSSSRYARFLPAMSKMPPENLQSALTASTARSRRGPISMAAKLATLGGISQVLPSEGFHRRAREGLGTLSGFPLLHHRVGEGGLRPPEPERGRVWEPSEGSHYTHRVGEGGLRPPEPERGRVWEPSEGSHYTHRVGGGGLRPPEPERGRVWEPSQGSHYYTSRRRRRASPAGARAREGLGTLRGFPSHRVGGGGLRPAEPERGRVWEPFQGSHHIA